MARLVSSVFQGWTEALASVMRDAIDAGELPAHLPPTVLATHIVATIEGGIMMSRLTKNAAPLLDSVNALRVFLGLEPRPTPAGATQSPSRPAGDGASP